MPSSTPKQARTMAAAAHNPAFAKKVGIPQGVAKDFNKADAGKKFPQKDMQAAQAKALKAPKPPMKPDMDGDGY